MNAQHNNSRQQGPINGIEGGRKGADEYYSIYMRVEEMDTAPNNAMATETGHSAAVVDQSQTRW